jgi:hypothetical protein
MKRTLLSGRFQRACIPIAAVCLVVLVAIGLSTYAQPRQAASSKALAQTTGAQRAAAPDDYMLVDSARLALLPTSGAAYGAMKRTADDAVASMDVSEPASSASPWLPNYQDASTGVGKGAATLAAALVYARTGDVRYRDFVIKVNRFVIGSENSASTNGTGDHDKSLAVMRQISAYVMAADLVGMDPNVTGSRAGWTGTVWKTWLGSLRAKQVGTTANKDTIIENNYMATNHSTWGFAARIAIDIYLGDRVDLAAAAERVKLFTGEITTGTPWTKSNAYDASWACLTGAPAGSFTPINPASCGAGKDGVIVEDASRSVHAFPTWDKAGIDYSFHGYGAQLVAAILLDRQGYDVWNWGDRAFKRVMDRLDRQGVATGNGRVTATHVSWIPRHFYGVNYPTVPAKPSDTLGYTDWLYGPGSIAIGKMTRDVSSGTALIAVRVPHAGKLVVTGRGLRRVTKRPMRAGTVQVRLRPTIRTLRRLDRNGRARVRARVRFSQSVHGSHIRRKTIELRKK